MLNTATNYQVVGGGLLVRGDRVFVVAESVRPMTGDTRTTIFWTPYPDGGITVG